MGDGVGVPTESFMVKVQLSILMVAVVTQSYTCDITAELYTHIYTHTSTYISGEN